MPDFISKSLHGFCQIIDKNKNEKGFFEAKPSKFKVPKPRVLSDPDTFINGQTSSVKLILLQMPRFQQIQTRYFLHNRNRLWYRYQEFAPR
jgi:hypothetical protein